MEKRPNSKTRKEQPTNTDKNLTFNRQFRKGYYGTQGEKNTLPSMTVPDQSLTILQLLQNHSRGIHSDVSDNEGEYFEEEPIRTYYDMNDIAEHRNELNQRAQSVKQAFDTEKAKKEVTPPKTDETAVIPPQTEEKQT